MTTHGMENAKALYLEGIRDGNVHEALEKYTGHRYTQHSTGVADGQDGFAAFFEPFLKRNSIRDVQIIHAFDDGRYVFLHAHQSLNHGEHRWVTMDMFDTDADGRIIEHWDVIAAYSDETPSGYNMVGETSELIDIDDIDKTQHNKSVVLEYVKQVLQGRGLTAIKRFVSESSSNTAQRFPLAEMAF